MSDDLDGITPPDGTIKFGFEKEMVSIDLDKIIPLQMISPGVQGSMKYKQIYASIKEIGVIEALVVTPCKDKPDYYFLLDGHLKLAILKDLGEKKALCLISTDDEAFTYNKHINRISIIQQHMMIVRAVESGVSEEKIAQALNVDVRSIILKRKMLDGICKEAIDILKDKMVAGGVFRVLKKMVPMRQIECADLMNSMNVYTVTYAKMLLTGTPKDKLVEPDKIKKVKGLDEEKMARMQSEMLSLQNEYRAIEDTLGGDVLNLTVAKRYVGKLMDNAKVVRYLRQNYPEILEEFQKIVDLQSINAKDRVEEPV